MKNVIRFPTETETDLSCFQLFKTLTDQELIRLNLDMTSRIYERKDIVYHEGSRLTGFYCITKGILKLYKTGTEGKEQIFRFAQSGDIIGYRSLVCRELADATAKVIKEAALCHIPYNTFLILEQNNWQFSQYMLQIACQELYEANNYLTSISQKYVKENLAEVLLLLKQKFDPDNTNTLQIPLSREELANATGTVKEHVTRLLGEFSRQKIIEVKGCEIKLLDLPTLKRIAKH